MNITVLFPRLDVMFKKGPVPEQRGSIPPIRLHWQQFAQTLINHHRLKGDRVEMIEEPLWKFTPEFAESLDADIIYVPHRERHAFPVNNKEARYYMQTVFPWQFYIDSKGYAGGASCYPFKYDSSAENDFYDKMCARAVLGESKFEQPAKKAFDTASEFILFACQIPHDETIKHHSDYNVEQALEATCKATAELNIPLYVKPHPVNPASQMPLLFIANKYKHVRWIEGVNIHDIMSKAKAVVVVNSGTGMEALLHRRPVITFGRCEYDCVTNQATTVNIVDILKNPVFNEKEVRAFFASWYNWTYDSRNPNSFKDL